MEAPLPPFSPVQWIELLGRAKRIWRLVLVSAPDFTQIPAGAGARSG